MVLLGRILLLISIIIFSSCVSTKGIADETTSSGLNTNLNPEEVESTQHIKQRLDLVQQFYDNALEYLNQEDWFATQKELDRASVLLFSISKSKAEQLGLGYLYQKKSDEIFSIYELTYPGVAQLNYQDSSFSYDFEVPNKARKPKLSIVDSLDFSKFSLPIVINDRVLHELEYLSQKVPSFIQGSLIRKTALDSMIYAKIKAKNMPADLIYLALVESGYKFKAYSSASASGVWQFIPSTGRHYGLKSNWWVDMRRNPELATDAALAFLSDLYRQFDDWYLAMAAYNAGGGRVRQAIRRDSSRNYWDLKLPKETMHYVPRIIAATIIGHHPEQFNFNTDSTLTWKDEFDTVLVSHCIPLKTIADSLEIPVDTLKDLNFELLRWSTPPSTKNYPLRVPKGMGEIFSEIYATMDTTKFTQWHRHKVSWGENLSVIASKYGIRVSDVKDANNMKSNRLNSGQYLIIPIPQGALSPIENKVSKKGVEQKELTMPPKGTSFRVYTVQQGDNLFDISRKMKVSIAELKFWNSMKSTRLDVGDTLKIYNWSSEKASISSRKKIQSNSSTQSLKTSSNSSFKGEKMVYTIESGDNLSYISQKFSVSISDIKNWNSLSSNNISVGQELFLYNVKENKKTIDDKSKVSNEKNISAGTWHLVRKGDTLWDISKRYGVTVRKLQEWNDLKDGLKPGIKLKVK